MSSQMVYTRITGPEVIIKLWQIFDSTNDLKSDNELIGEIRQQLSSTLNFKKKSITDDQCLRIVYNAIEDKLLIDGNGIGLSRIKPSYNRLSFGYLTNDWFCFECHSHGLNCPPIDLRCETCFRAFHRKCIGTMVSNDFCCDYCRKAEHFDKTLKINVLDKTSMNQMFDKVLKNFENSIDDFDIYSEYELPSNPKKEVLIFKPMDLVTIKLKIESEDYNNVEELENDFKHFIHNFRVYRINGLNEDFETFLDENLSYLKACSQCFGQMFNKDKADLSGNEQRFVRQLCDPPHRLVYALVPQHPFWPSKVIKEISGDKYLVQFFESPLFERSIVSGASIRPIDYQFEAKKYRNVELRESFVLLSQHMKILVDSGVNPDNQYTNALNLLETKRLLEPYQPKSPNSPTKKLKTNNSQAIPTNCGQNPMAEESEAEDFSQKTDTSDEWMPVAGPSTQSSSSKANRQQVSANRLAVPVNQGASTSAQTSGDTGTASYKKNWQRFFDDPDIDSQDKYKICRIIQKLAALRVKEQRQKDGPNGPNGPNKSDNQ